MTEKHLHESFHHLRILVVEDGDLSRELFRKALRAEHTVYLAADAREGWRLFIDKKPDIAFVDIGLPDADGHDLSRRMKEEYPESFVIIATANDFIEDREKADLHHADGFVAKPFTKQEINDYIDHCMALRQR